jgi:NTE family protein
MIEVEQTSSTSLSLALSGGGVRALVFHLGVLKFLAELGLFENVTHISSVSGGSLATGLIYANAGIRWPTSKAFLTTVYPAVKQKVCGRSLILDSLSQLLRPSNWRYLLSRANLVGKALQEHWDMDFTLRELSPYPTWSINATTAENGKRFRFKGSTIGDYEGGYAEASDLSVSTAVAVSAAFPGGIGPLALPTADYDWKKRKWGELESAAKTVVPEFSTLHLYDGGVYDNLGLEPLFDAGNGKPKAQGSVVIALDAGAPLAQGFSAIALNPWRLKRVADIMADQARSLRVRTFVEYLKRTNAGAFIQMDSPLFNRATDPNADFACTFPTTLRRLSELEFDRLAGHGYAVAKRVYETYGLGTTERKSQEVTM